MCGSMAGEALRTVVACILIAASVAASYGQLMSKEHRTHAASERPNDLWCYQCDTLDDGELCSDLSANYSSFIQKCKDDKRICRVKRVSYTMSTENSTSSPQTWSMERDCTSKCESGCIVIGERAKIYSCTACCDKSLCNTGNGTGHDLAVKRLNFLLALILQLVLTVTVYPS